MVEKYWEGKKVIITGASGFIGAALCNALHQRGAEIYGIFRHADNEKLKFFDLQDKIKIVNCDILQLDSLKEKFAGIKPEICYHLAAQSNVGKANSIIYETLNTNILGTLNICECCKETNSAIVFSSSGKVYGGAERKELGEGATLMGKGPYALSKIIGEEIIHLYAENFNMKTAILRLGNVYGPKDLNLERIIPNTIKLALCDESPVVSGDGTMKRNFVYINDVVDAFLKVGEKIEAKGISGETFNIASGEIISTKGIVEEILKTMGKKNLPIKFKPEEYAGEQEARFAIEKAKQVLHWKPNYSLERGLRETIEWYKEYFK